MILGAESASSSCELTSNFGPLRVRLMGAGQRLAPIFIQEESSLFKLLLTTVIMLWLSVAALAQIGVRGQIYLPNGAPVQKQTRFTLITENGMRNEIYYTDSNGRISMPRITTPYTITVDSDGETYDTTTESFNPLHAGNHIVIHLRPLIPSKSNPPKVVKANEMDAEVSPKAKAAYEEATTLVQAEKYEQAIPLLQRAISFQPDYFDPHNDLGVIYMKMNRLDEAANSFRQAIKIDAAHHLPRLNLGIVLNRQQKYKEAAEVLRKIRRNDPTMSAARALLVESLIGSQNWVEAEKELKNALVMKDDDEVDLKVKLGMVLIRQAKFDAAIGPLREAVKAEPDSALAHFNLGAALLETGALDEAESALRRAYELKGASMPGAQLMLGQVYFQKKDYPKAIEAFEAYLRDLPNAPNGDQVKKAIRQLRGSP